MFSQPFLVFLQVAESGSFSKAAARLLVTPASVMKHMNTLEGRLGLTLVRRSNQGIELTAAGPLPGGTETLPSRGDCPGQSP